MIVMFSLGEQILKYRFIALLYYQPFDPATI